MLPQIMMPTYALRIPSSGEEIRVRPFTVKEEKLLLLALQTDETKEIVATVKQVIKNCITEGDVNIDKLPFFDVDYMFVFLRAKSISDKVDMMITCRNEIDGQECGHKFAGKIDIADNEIVYQPDIENTIRIGGGVGIVMRYPTYADMKAGEKHQTEYDENIEIIINSIESIFDKDGVHAAKDYSREELKTFIEGLTEENYKKLEAYITNFPKVNVILETDCPKCKYHHKLRYQDLSDFFL